MTASTVRLSGLGEVAERFDVFLLDQFGVLHDGTAPYPNAVEAIEELAARGKKLGVLSNSGQRTAPNRERLAELGIPVDRLTLVVTSGEVAHDLLTARRDEPWRSLGRRCLFYSRDDDLAPVEGLDLELVERPNDADFVFLAGSRTPAWSLADYVHLLRPAVERGLPLLCTNPDRVAVGPSGLRLSAGGIAAWYEEAGGLVHYVGKPHPEIYRACLAAMGEPPRERVAVVGDSFEHDVAGGIASGLATIFVEGGIHADVFKAGNADAVLHTLAEEHRVTPAYTLAGVRW
ncbi:TIGR01459 family HAD-type hydrolase [Marinivivus vitaminiproducens]|uniref:TIGR01459 family HAD-type hydrolase n=1 Tax=Marinivivus vitaminiproducens TaxID=3035935 RepID=UPI0027A33074|nr:TIGR01459 family HAD-type hydrolase [Geminicoccaceae bacterium SCSIO 64248]